MKRILTTALAIALFVGAAQAQSTTTPPQDHTRGQGKGAMQGLNLTADQKAQLKSIREAEKKEMDALKAGGAVTPEQRKALRQKYRSQLDAVLTPEQREQMKNSMKTHRMDSTGKGGRSFERKGDRFGKATSFLNQDLNLTADQQTKLKSYADDFRAKAEDLRGNASLTDDQRKEQMRSLAKQYMEQSKAVLTPEQVQKLKDGYGKRKGNGAQNT